MKEINFTLADAAVVARDICKKININGSVATVRALKKTLEMYGYNDIKVLSTQVLIFNPYVTNEFKPGKSPSNKRLNELLKNKRGHAENIGMDKNGAEFSWKGHLILVLKNTEGTWLIDPTLDQATNREHNIQMLPIGVKVDESFGSFDGSRTFLKLNGCAVIYSAFPSDVTYKDLIDWKEFSVDKISNQIFEYLATGA